MVPIPKRLLLPTHSSLEDRAASIISTAVAQLKTEQEIWKALRVGGIDVRRLPSRFVGTTLEDCLKAARGAASALRVRKKTQDRLTSRGHHRQTPKVG